MLSPFLLAGMLLCWAPDEPEPAELPMWPSYGRISNIVELQSDASFKAIVVWHASSELEIRKTNSGRDLQIRLLADDDGFYRAGRYQVICTVYEGVNLPKRRVFYLSVD